MKLVFTAQGTDWDSPMDPRFGRTPYFLVYDEDTEEIQSHDNSDVENMAHGAGPKAAQAVADLGARVLITGNGPGGNAAVALEATSMEVWVGAGEMTVRKAYEAYRAGALTRL